MKVSTFYLIIINQLRVNINNTCQFFKGFYAFLLTYGGLWHSLWYEHILSCWMLFLSMISVPAEEETETIRRFEHE